MFLRNVLKAITKDSVKNSVRFLSKEPISSSQRLVNPLGLVYSLNSTQNHWIYRENTSIQTPIINRIQTKIDLPNGIIWTPFEDKISDVVEKTDPTLTSNEPLEAARLIVIRRIKMNKHKLKKLRKRMKFEWAKRRQRRELKREKLFQAGLIAQIKKAEAFSAEDFVKEKLRQAVEGPLEPPTYVNPLSLSNKPR